jgi:hypothetical protein
MVFLIRAGISLATAALGILLSALLLPGFAVQVLGFLTAVVVLAAASTLLAPVATKLGERWAPALIGGVGLITTFVSLLIASLMPNGITITGIGTWVLATVIVWICTAAGGWILVALFIRNRRQARTR